jgi:long-subunit fatty acid transport protein
VGATIDFPTKFSIDQDFTFNYDSTDAISRDRVIIESEELGHYDLTHPYSFGAGAALNFKFVTLAGDVNFTDWSQLKPSARGGVDERLYKEIYQEVTRWHVGAEFNMPELATKLRIGFYADPIPFKSVYLKTDRRYFTLGAGFLIDQVMTLDVAWNHGINEFRDSFSQMIKESYTTDKFFVSLAYRL